MTGFASDKVRALLAYLAVEIEQPHRREKLAGLLWPEWPETSARANLRRALANLRQVIRDDAADPPFLHISRQTLQFNRESDAWIDVAAFTDLAWAGDLSQPTLEQLEEAGKLYRADFLEGFSVGDCPAFEEWLLVNRERFRRLALDALYALADYHEQRGDYEQGLAHAWRQVELDPWREKSHRQLMRLLALAGQRGAALAQYENCRRVLAHELGAAPGEDTTRLYEQIRDGKLGAAAPRTPYPAIAVASPRFLEAEPPETEAWVFVARERELARLEESLEQALAGQGRVVFVTGEAGSGKTALAQEFARRAQEDHPSLVVATGNCNAYTGAGDPYLPFREILELLAGDVEARWAAGAMTGERAQRLWNAFPHTARALVDAAPDLIDSFVPGAALLERALVSAPNGADWVTDLKRLLDRGSIDPGVAQSRPIAIFGQYTGLLQALQRSGPLMLVLDDLQWADAGSVELLFHVGRRLAGSRVLILGTYRAEEVAIGRDGERHPLLPVVNELQRTFGDITVDLGRAESRAFVDALLDSEPNQLGVEFREKLYRQTGGHPLFTIELLRGLQERGDLIRAPDGRWTEGPTLDWETLPARVEAVIAERIGRLPEPLQAVLRVASVEGEVFTAEVVARVRAADEGQVLGQLSGQLDRTHHLVHAQGIARADGQRLSRYRFRHILYQTYLYSSLDEVEKAFLHESVGSTLEALHKDQPGLMSTIAGQLARHFQEAGMAEKAIDYLRQAGERAVRLSAYEEGIAHLTTGLDLFAALPEPGSEEERLDRARQELGLQLALGIAWIGRSAYGPKGEQAYTRARELSQLLGETPQLCLVLGRLSMFHMLRGDYRKAQELAEEALTLAQRAQDPLHIALGHRHLGCVLFCQAEFAAARAQLGHMISFYQPEQHHRYLVSLRGSDAGTSALSYDACCLWCLGYPEQAFARSQEVLALARELGHPFSLGDVLCFAGGILSGMRRDARALREIGEELVRLAEERVPAWTGVGAVYRGEALAMQGQVRQGIVQMHEGVTAVKSWGDQLTLPGALLFLAEAQAKAGHRKEGLATLAEANSMMEETGERFMEAELHRLRGELLLEQGRDEDAEVSFLTAIDVARRQSARSWELRAMVSLCRLWERQGQREEARQLLADIYGWFTEGFETPDLIEARTLLEELSS